MFWDQRNIKFWARLPLMTVQVHGVDIDFVNLRSETYADGSRIPEMQFGTAQEVPPANNAALNAHNYYGCHCVLLISHFWESPANGLVPASFLCWSPVYWAIQGAYQSWGADKYCFSIDFTCNDQQDRRRSLSICRCGEPMSWGVQDMMLWLQDALRRDLTINALFYNLSSRTVEDYTEQGIPDLHAGICRTPLAPQETFMDGASFL